MLCRSLIRNITNLVGFGSFICFFVVSAHATEQLRDAQLEQALDATLGIGMAPSDREGLNRVLSEINEHTPVLTYIRARAYQALALAIRDADRAQAMQILDELLANDDFIGLPDGHAELLNTRAEIYLHREDRDEITAAIPQLEQQRAGITDTRILYHRLHLLGRGYELNHQYRPALEYMLQAHEVLMTIEDAHIQRRRQFLNLHRARIMARLRDYDRAYELLNRTIDDAYRYGNEGRLPDLYIIRGYVKQRVEGSNSDAKADFIKAAEPAPGQPVTRTQMLALNNLGAIDLHAQLYDSAYDYFQQGIAIAETLNNQYEVHVMRFNLGYVQVKQENYDVGLVQMEAAFADFEQIAPLNAKADMLSYLGDAYQEAGNLNRALEITRQQLQLREQAFNNEREQVTSELQVRFDIQESELRIRLLEQESALRDAQLSNQQRQQVWLIIIGLLLAVGLFLALLATRHVRKLNARLSNANTELAEQSYRDPLTQLYNRRALQKFPQQGGDLLILIDLDHFKQINDEFGHEVGDKVLISIGERLQNALRSNDLVARWGGEEFLVIVRRVDDIGVEQVISKVREALDHTPSPGVEVRASGGAVLITSDADTWEQAIQRADELLYRAKAHGRARFIGDIDGVEQEWD